MSLQWTRAGLLRHLRLGTTFSPTRVIAVQNQLRSLSLSAEPRSKTPQTGSFSAFVSQSRALSTQTETKTESTKPKRGRPLGSTKAAGQDKTAPKKPAVKAKKAKKPLTDKQKEDKAKSARFAHIKELKVLALSPPAKLTASAWPLGVKEMYDSVKSGSGNSQEKLTEAINKVKAMSPEEYKKLEEKAAQNRATNAANYMAWIKSHPPKQIKEANSARRSLSRLQKKRIVPLEDDRQVKRPRIAYFFFMLERMSDGDLKGKGGPDLARIVGEEWSKLTEYEKQVHTTISLDLTIIPKLTIYIQTYKDKQAEDRGRFEREYQEVYGEAPGPSTAKDME
ncbi:High mobility group superfamily [Penicillium atrosanguineum]|nr:High mobility group superfamily [Penicillium atrosanguineum]